MPTEAQHAERLFSGGLGRRAVFGCCADCGKTLDELTLLVCSSCRKSPKNVNDATFADRERGHAQKIGALFGGVRDSKMTLEKANELYRKHQRKKEKKAA